ncbi:related to Autophagy-related protein 9 [Ramularia collo-cygni]|uniref:Autophagy-related protein 9 n=1 Tax=Ramularia collo-cygni TaxID=112498 RepID=A0A2D3UL87_9PEZI|nr:related to Autophagy-related protein 9 [Ramularia collo-cygni]CZT14102.1 related to Autophagy-related protein 9 [Ramularia collo-cygni]
MDDLLSSRVLSRFLPVAEGDVSVYEGLRHNPSRIPPDVEAQRAGRNPARYHQPFHDEDEDDDPDAFLYNVNESSPSTASPVMTQPRGQQSKGKRGRRADEDDDVPESLLMELKKGGKSRTGISRGTGGVGGGMMESKLAKAEAQWRTTQEQQGLHPSHAPRNPRAHSRSSFPASTAPPMGNRPNPQADAMWLYTNASNLDGFLLEIYQYFVGHGVWSILLSRILTLLTELFVFTFSMFLTTCIDYSKIPHSKSTSEVLIGKCIAKASWFKHAAIFFFVIYWLSRLLQSLQDTRRLLRMRDFYQHVLGISDDDLQTVSWRRVVDGMVKVQNAHVATAKISPNAKKYMKYKEPQQKLTAESIANRLMRQDNYFVVLYNKDILDFTLPLPFVGTRQFYSKSLEWCIGLCLSNFIFDEQGSIRPFCLDVKNRAALVGAMRTRFRIAALASVVLSPFNIIRFCLLYFLRYYTEFTRNPSKASARSFTPFAEWKMRQLNELQHLFDRRLKQAYPFANDYLKQFPKDKTDQICRFVAFISGSFAAVLTLATLLDSELFLGFEVTPGRTVVFWLTVMGVIFGIAHGSLPDENETHDPIIHLRDVLYFTHYMPSHWKDRLHSNEVKAEFSAMYQMKVLIFVEEMLSLVVAPFILWRNSEARQCERLIDFFREQTVHVEGIGHQCNFAVFGFKKDVNVSDPREVLEGEDGLRDDYYGLKDEKMEASIQNFAQYYSHYRERKGEGGHRRGASGGGGWQAPREWSDMRKSGTPAIREEGAGRRSERRGPSSSTMLSPRQTAAHHSRHPPPTSRRKVAAPFSPPTQPSRGGAPLGGITESRIMADDSDLKDFADAPGNIGGMLDSSDDDDSEAEDGEKRDGVGNAGVLGMLSQFAKAQTTLDGKGVAGAVGV